MSKVLISDVAVINKKNIEFNKNLKYINYLDTSSITNNKIDGYQTLYIDKDKIPSRAKRLVKNNTIVYSSVRPRLCHFGILKDLPENPVVSTGFITIDAKEDIIDPFYLYYILTSKANTEYLSSIADTSVSSYPSINPSDISNMEINIIEDINEQKKIANILKAIEFRIENNNKINEELESMAKTIYDYWFLQFEFPNEEGKPYKSSGGKMVWNDELKREIPKGWEVHNLKNILSKNNSTKKLKTNEYLTKGKIPIIDQSSEFICGFTNDEELALHYDDVIVFGDHTQIVKYINFEFARGADGTQIINSKNERLSNYLLYHQIKSMNLVIQGYSRYFKFLKEKYIIVPSKDINDRYLKITKNFNDRIKNNLFENLELESIRDFLLPLLMNGQVVFRELALAED